MLFLKVGGHTMPTKKYIKIKNYLLTQIKNGVYQIDQAIPSERELAAFFEVNRMTVRKAIEELMYEGILVRRKGSGTYLSKNKVTRLDYVTNHSSFEQYDFATKIISIKEMTDGEYGLKALNLKEGQKYFRVRRVRSANNVPYAYEDIYFNAMFFDEVDKDLLKLGLKQMMLQYCKNIKMKIYEEVESLLCLKTTANLLKVKVDSPILQIKTHYETDEYVVMYCRSYHPGDYYKYVSNKREFCQED